MPSSEERRRLSGRYDKAHGFAGGNDEPTAATTQIVAGPTGSEIDLTAGSAFHRPDADDAFRLWNLAPLLPPDQRFTRVFKGRGELIDHLFASHRLVNPANLPTVQTIRIPVTVTIRDARPAPLFLHLAIDLLPLLLILAALWHLWGLLRSARQGDPFTTANVRRLHTFGWLLLLGWPLVAYLTMALKGDLAATVPADVTSGLFAPPIPLALVFGLAVLVLAEVFAHGLRLREDVEGHHLRCPPSPPTTTSPST
jgi:Protein of unknown function (DUF2975)